MSRHRRNLPTWSEYIFDACERVHRIGGVPRINIIDEIPGLAIFEATIDMLPGENARVEIMEVIRRTDNNHAHREKYRYACFLDGEMAFRYDRHPTGHQHDPDHKHLADGARQWCAITLQTMLDEVWDELAAEKDRRLRVA